MRTDPRAEEVRAIVEKVFCGYLGLLKSSREVDEVAAGFAGNERLRPAGRFRAGSTFPRLYQPDRRAADKIRKPNGRVAAEAEFDASCGRQEHKKRVAGRNFSRQTGPDVLLHPCLSRASSVPPHLSSS